MDEVRTLYSVYIDMYVRMYLYIFLFLFTSTQSITVDSSPASLLKVTLYAQVVYQFSVRILRTSCMYSCILQASSPSRSPF